MTRSTTGEVMVVDDPMGEGGDPIGSTPPPGRPADRAPGGPPMPPGLRLARLGPDCPARPVDWRWQRAGLMLASGLRGSRRRDDGPTRAAKRFRAALGRCRDAAARGRLAARVPGVGGAYAIAAGPPPLRWAVEARLLAGEPVAAIAAKVGATASAVAWYEAVFFHVSDRLGSRGYIAHAAIGPVAVAGRGAGDEGALLKRIAYHAGPAALDLASAALGPAASASDAGEAIRAALTRLRQSLTPTAPARAHRRSSPGKAAPRSRPAASVRKEARRAADPPPPGVPIAPGGSSGGAGPEAGSRGRIRGRRAGSREVGDGPLTR